MNYLLKIKEKEVRKLFLLSFGSDQQTEADCVANKAEPDQKCYVVWLDNDHEL
jgi:hypothetical protein